MYYGLISSMNKTVASAYTARTTAFIAATGISDTTIINALNTMDLSLISAGLDTKMKALYPFVGASASTHKYNFMDARDLDAAFRLTFNGGWTHSSTGALPNGTNAYAETYLTPSISLSQNNTHISYYSRTNRSKDYGVPIGSYDNVNNSQLLLFARTTGNAMFSRINTLNFGGDTYSGITDSKGFYIGNRIISTYSKLFRNGTSLGNGAIVSYNLPTNTTVIGAVNTPFGLNFYDNEELAIASIGNGLSDSEASSFYTIVQTFQTSLFRNV